MPEIPERQPVADYFRGLILQAGDRAVLARQPVEDAEVLFSGDVIIRYSLVYLERPHLSIVPGLVALDYGEMLAGEDALDFLLHRSNLYPRADVLGYRHDGEDDMIVVKKLDLARPVRVLAYETPEAIVPLAEIDALIAVSSDGLPERLRDHLPVYPSLTAWQTDRNRKKDA